MNRRKVAYVAAVVFSLAAAVISHQLLQKHITGSKGAGWFEAGCTDDPTPGGRNCAAVLASPYSYFPIRKTETPDGRLRFPVAFLGLVYYSALTVWWIGLGPGSGRRRRLHVVPLLVIGSGLAGSAYFTFIMFRVLDQWCPWCLVTHGLNVLIGLCAVMMWPGRAAIGSSPCVPRPATTRLVGVTLIAVAAVANGQLKGLGLQTWKQQTAVATESYNACLTAVNRIKSDPQTFVRAWQAAPQRSIVIRPDDPIRRGPGADSDALTFEVVVFSDFECPSCRRFALFLEEQAQPLFAGRIKTVFKHYPIDQTCNARAGKTMHPHACEAVRMAEAARTLGGSAAFWKAHDYLYKNRDSLAAGRVTVSQVAAALGLGESALATAMQSEQIQARLNEDIEQAKNCDIRGTPAVFVEGRLVDTLVVTEVGFWDQLADRYWQQFKTVRPDSTRPPSGSVPSASITPDTPGPKGGP